MDCMSVDSKFFGEKNAALMKKMKENEARFNSTDMQRKSREFIKMQRRPFKKTPQEGEEINYIDYNKRLSPLARILGKDKAIGALRTQMMNISTRGGKFGTPVQTPRSGLGDHQAVFLTDDVNITSDMKSNITKRYLS